MPKYIATHTLPPGALTEQQVNEIAQASQQVSTVRGYRSFLNLSEGKAFCLFEAPNEQALASWFQKVGVPVDSILQVELEGDRGVIQKS